MSCQKKCCLIFHDFRTIDTYNKKFDHSQIEYIANQKRLEELRQKVGEHQTDILKKLMSSKQNELDKEVS